MRRDGRILPLYTFWLVQLQPFLKVNWFTERSKFRFSRNIVIIPCTVFHPKKRGTGTLLGEWSQDANQTTDSSDPCHAKKPAGFAECVCAQNNWLELHSCSPFMVCVVLLKYNHQTVFFQLNLCIFLLYLILWLPPEWFLVQGVTKNELAGGCHGKVLRWELNHESDRSARQHRFWSLRLQTLESFCGLGSSLSN